MRRCRSSSRIPLPTLVQGHGDRACGIACPAGQALADDRCLPTAVLAHAANSGAPRTAALPAPAASPASVAMSWSTTTAAQPPHHLGDARASAAKPGEAQPTPPCRPTRSSGPQTNASQGGGLATGASPARQLRAGLPQAHRCHGHVLKPRVRPGTHGAFSRQQRGLPRSACLPKRRPSPMTLRLTQPGSRSSSEVEQRIRNAPPIKFPR